MPKRKKNHQNIERKSLEKKILVNEEFGVPGIASDHYLLYGKHAVLSALANPERQVRRLLLTNGIWYESRPPTSNKIITVKSTSTHHTYTLGPGAPPPVEAIAAFAEEMPTTRARAVVKTKKLK